MPPCSARVRGGAAMSLRWFVIRLLRDAVVQSMDAGVWAFRSELGRSLVCPMTRLVADALARLDHEVGMTPERRAHRLCTDEQRCKGHPLGL